MKRIGTFLLPAIGAALYLSMGTAVAAEINSKKDCEAAEGMVSRIDRALTCTVPMLPAEFKVAEKTVDQCNGELLDGGMFCRIIIDKAYKTAAPDCAAVETAKADPDFGYEIWLAESKRPHTDAWKCEKLAK